ncbi:MAG: hypothetical protein ACTS3F_12620 [Phycisphaerales bacterium]
MDTFLPILLLITLALLTTSRWAYTLRRSRTMTAMHSGGWIALLVGVAIGPTLTGLVDRGAILASMPLIQIALGWIGFVVGLQLRRDLLRKVPAPIARRVALDAIGTIAIAAPLVLLIGAGVADRWVGAVGLAAAAVGAAMVGWAMETRSARFTDEPEHQSAALALRISGGLAAAIAIATFAAASSFLAGLPEEHGSGPPLAGRAIAVLMLTLVIAIATALLAWFGVSRARDRDQQLTVFLGILAIAAGLSSQTGAATMCAAMLAGAVVANLPGTGLRAFERFVLGGEHAVAAIVALLAGVLLEWQKHPWALVLAAGLIAMRLLIKPAIARSMVRAVLDAPSDGDESKPADRAAPRTTATALAGASAIRQSPIALALTVSLVLVAPNDATRSALVAIVIAGIACEIIALIIRRRILRAHASDRAGIPDPANARSPDPPDRPPGSRRIGSGAGRAEREAAQQQQGGDR